MALAGVDFCSTHGFGLMGLEVTPSQRPAVVEREAKKTPTLASIARELDLQPHELRNFIGLDNSFSLTDEVSEHDYVTILKLVEYDLAHTH